MSYQVTFMSQKESEVEALVFDSPYMTLIIENLLGVATPILCKIGYATKQKQNKTKTKKTKKAWLNEG